MNNQFYYRIGGHNLSLTISEENTELLVLGQYRPFLTEARDETLYNVEVVEELNPTIVAPIIIDKDTAEGMVKVDIYSTARGFLYNLTLPDSDILNASIEIDYEGHNAKVKLDGDRLSKLLAFNNAMILSYITYTIEYATLLIHSSTVIKDGRAYAFLGRSGTGKSTHSKMWLSAFPECELLNDDHPIIRVHDNGEAIIYGSPWSGKTHCYRNLEAPLAAVVRIEQYPENKIERLSALKAIGSITTSCSGAQWSKQLIDSKMSAIDKVVKAVPMYLLKCLPSTSAAILCHNSINE